MIRNIVLIGAGNLATHLGIALVKKGLNIRQVYSKNIENAQVLADKFDAYAVDDLKEIRNGSDLYIIAVSDSVVPQVVAGLPDLEGIVVHTAGSLGVELLNRFKASGILYPFQTFSKDRAVDFGMIPILIESNSPEIEKSLLQLGKAISNTVLTCNSAQRGKIHLAAVFACNFTNHMYAIANKILNDDGIGFEVMLPLIKETANKIEILSPKQAQTGPAVREDFNVINKHLSLLADDGELQYLYKILTERIIKTK